MNWIMDLPEPLSRELVRKWMFVDVLAELQRVMILRELRQQFWLMARYVPPVILSTPNSSFFY